MQGGLHLGHASLVDTGGRVEDDTRRRGLHFGISLALARVTLRKIRSTMLSTTPARCMK